MWFGLEGFIGRLLFGQRTLVGVTGTAIVLLVGCSFITFLIVDAAFIMRLGLDADAFVGLMSLEFGGGFKYTNCSIFEILN